MRNCGHCHTCGAELRKELVEEWCPTCRMYHRYKSHDWDDVGTGEDICPKHKHAKRCAKGASNVNAQK